MVQVNWNDLYYRPIRRHSVMSPLIIASKLVDPLATVELGAPFGNVSLPRVTDAATPYMALSDGTCQPQFAACIFDITHKPDALNPYFPLTKTLKKSAQKKFYRLIQHIICSPNFDLRLYDRRRDDLSTRMPPHVVYLVAGHIAEIFFYRQDILERLLSTPRHIWLYTTQEAFAKDGGVAGGCFSRERGCLQLVLSRLYEGFNDRTPGVAPFLHEFGHMLDHFDASTGKLGKSNGSLPGMRREDGEIDTPEARALFIKGKRLELDRYTALHEDNYQDGDPPPIGHPYVFQNDTEFIAGYFEMFFRNPHYFAEMNPDLYQGFALLFKQDPREAWEQDFPFYIQQNRDFYLKSGKRPPLPGITIPEV